MPAKKKRKLRGKKGQAEEPVNNVTVNANPNVNVQAKLSSGKKWWEKILPSAGTLVFVVILAALIFFFFFNVGGRSLAVAAGVYFQDTGARVINVLGNIGDFFADPSGAVLDPNDNAVNVGPKQQGVVVTDYRSQQQTYIAGQDDAIMKAEITVLPFEVLPDVKIVSFDVQCFIQDPTSNLGVRTDNLGDRDNSGATPFNLVPDLGLNPRQGQVRVVPFGAPEYTNKAEIQLTPEQTQAPQKFTVYCKFPKELTSDAAPTSSKTTINSVFTQLLITYQTRSVSTLNVYTYNRKPEDALLTQFKEQIAKEGITSQNDRINSKTAGGSMSLDQNLDIAQPITPIGEDLFIPLDVSLKNTQGWPGRLGTLNALTLERIPGAFDINAEQCTQFTPSGGSAELKSEIIDKVNQCAQLQTKKERDACGYDIDKLHFYCEFILPSDPAAYSGQLGDAQVLRASATYNYIFTRLGNVGFKRPPTQ